MIELRAEGRDNVGIVRVEFVRDDSITLGDAVLNVSPPSDAWMVNATKSVDTRKLSNGMHSIYTKAYDAAGNVAMSDAIRVTVAN
jgi:hypothetical protein